MCGWLCAIFFCGISDIWRYTTISNNDLIINEQIRDKEVMVIDPNGVNVGVMPIRDALNLADEAGVDLVKVSSGKTPVCKIVDAGKYRYEKARKEKEQKKKQRIIEIKEVRLSPNIEENDINTKVNAARKFIQNGDRVKVTLRYRGREMAHMQETIVILDDFAKRLEDIAIVDKAPKIEGRSVQMFLSEKR